MLQKRSNIGFFDNPFKLECIFKKIKRIAKYQQVLLVMNGMGEINVILLMVNYPKRKGAP